MCKHIHVHFPFSPSNPSFPPQTTLEMTSLNTSQYEVITTGTPTLIHEKKSHLVPKHLPSSPSFSSFINLQKLKTLSSSFQQSRSPIKANETRPEEEVTSTLIHQFSSPSTHKRKRIDSSEERRVESEEEEEFEKEVLKNTSKFPGKYTVAQDILIKDTIQAR